MDHLGNIQPSERKLKQRKFHHRKHARDNTSRSRNTFGKFLVYYLTTTKKIFSNHLPDKLANIAQKKPKSIWLQFMSYLIFISLNSKNHTVTHIFIDLSRNFYTNERTWKFLGKSHQRVHAGYNGSRSCDTFGRGAVSSLLCSI